MNHTGWTNWTHKAWLACSAAVLLAAVATLPARAAEQGVPRGVGAAALADTGRVIVKFKSGASVLARSGILSASATAKAGPQAASTLATRLGIASLADGRVMSERMQIMTSSALGSAALAARLAADSEVEWAVVDGRRSALAAPNDPLYPSGLPANVNSLAAGQWYLHAPDSSVKSAVNAENAWALTQGSSSVVVAVLDTGVRPDHPDFAGKLLSGYDFVSDAATGNDGDGRDSDPSDPGDWITSAEDASGTFKGCGAETSSWHGTQTAGLIGAATNNSTGMAGMAPNVLLLPLRVLGKCGGYDSDIIDAMRWAAGISVSGVADNTHPAKVINMSLGSSGSCTAAYEDAIADVTAKGATIVVAAGNDGLAVGTPANCAGVIAVAGLRHAGTKSGFSDLGPEVSIAAPAGNCVNASGACLYSMLSTTNSGTQGPGTNTYSDAYNYALGTSFSAPLVAGTAALMVSINPSLTPAAIRSLIRSSARTFPTATESGVAACTQPTSTEQTECACTTGTCGAGMLDAGAAVLAAQNASSRPVPVVLPSEVSAAMGSTVTLTANGTLVPAGRSIASYLWQVTDGSASIASATGRARAQATTSTNASVTLTALDEGETTVQLTVTDSSGASASAAQTLAVSAVAPTAAIAADISSPEVGDAVTLNGVGSTAAGNATIVSYAWSLVGGSTIATLQGSTGLQVDLQGNAVGSATVQLTVTDSNGLTGTTTRTVTFAKASSSGGGGGGAAGSPIWAALLLLIGLGLPRRRTRG
ncbi:S8 family serine peptidase [Ideonella azotifigens]|uniref:S8 family peptidase n=2 Tax=Ideonella azotifigens TaxID=513160 RepID=UPI001E621EAB|nr:S8 family serine peptidase [Ideonella azotifigens]MCD2339701.1 S8 family serine peptidase [Ideonella azotifigens]